MTSTPHRLVSGMRPTGMLHIGHYYGTLSNWVRLQQDYRCFYFVADCHALTTKFDHTDQFGSHVTEMVIDWIGAGLDPQTSTFFLQSWVPEHAELFLLLSMIVPRGWLERVPSYKDLKSNLDGTEHDTYGLLGYPLLQAADILVYRAQYVPVGADQVAHIELTREIARRFNNLYDTSTDFKQEIQGILSRLNQQTRADFLDLRQVCTSSGDPQARQRGRALVNTIPELTIHDRLAMFGYLEGERPSVLVEPEAVVTPTAKIFGTDGRKMSKSFNNDIGMREEPDSIRAKLKTMVTDPARKRRTDKGNPDRCPVWSLHQAASDQQDRDWVREGCTTAGIGCVECKSRLADNIVAFTDAHRQRCREYDTSPSMVRDLLTEGSALARDVANETLKDVKDAAKLLTLSQ